MQEAGAAFLAPEKYIPDDPDRQADNEILLRRAIEAAKKAEKLGERNGEKKNAIKMIKAGKLSIEDIPEFFTSLTQEDIKEIEKELMQTV